MYPAGWAQVGNTPFKRYKQHTHAGGIRDSLIVSWPARIHDRGAIRSQYHHAVDITPTVLELVGAPAPDVLNGVPQQPIEGTSLAYSFAAAASPSPKVVQYYEMLGNRAIWHDGWKAVTYHAPGTDFAADRWELYNTEEDVSETADLAEQFPDKLEPLVDLWWREAKRYQVLPLDDRILERFQVSKPNPSTARQSFVYYPGPRIPAQAAVDTKNVSYSITAFVERPDVDVDGVLISCGDRFGGFVLYVQGDRLVHDYNCAGTHYIIESTVPVPTGRVALRYTFTKTGEQQGDGGLYIDGQNVGQGHLDQTLAVSFGTAGICVGRSPLTPVSSAYNGPFLFAGTIDKVVIELEDDRTVTSNDILD
jgi:arylsulfatase